MSETARLSILHSFAGPLGEAVPAFLHSFAGPPGEAVPAFLHSFAGPLGEAVPAIRLSSQKGRDASPRRPGEWSVNE